MLGSGLLTLIAFVRAGFALFWAGAEPPGAVQEAVRPREWIPVAILVSCSILMVIAAAPLKDHLDRTAAQIAAPADYVAAVLGPTTDRTPRALDRQGPP